MRLPEDVAAPGPGHVCQRAPDFTQEAAFVGIDDRLLALFGEQYAALLASAVFGTQTFANRGLGHDLINKPRPELLHQVERQTGSLVLVGVQQADSGVHGK